MRHFKIMGLCLVAVFAMTAFAAASASAALPEVMQCGHAKQETVTVNGKPKKVYTGSYTEAKCKTSAPAGKYRAGGKPEGKYELEGWNLGSKTEKTGKEGKKKEFKGTGSASFLEIVGLGPVKCESGSDTGYFSGPKEVDDVNVTFKGCNLNKILCHSEGAKAGEIKTNTLKGTIGYVDEAFGAPIAKVVGVELKPESELSFAEWTCGTLLLRVSKQKQGGKTGAVIGEVVPPYNDFTTEVKLKFEQSAGKQGILAFEGQPEEQLGTETWNGTSWNEPAESGQSGEAVNKGEELELKA